MIIGMLWFDNSKADLFDKLNRAAEYYSKKYGRAPDQILVNPKALADIKPADLANLDYLVRPYHPVLPFHFWVGCEQELVEDKNG